MTCPTCQAKVVRALPKIAPFCSERCQLADLGRWLGEEYRIPDPQTPIDDRDLAALDAERRS